MKYSARSFIDVDTREKEVKDDTLTHPMRRSPIPDVSPSQTASINGSKRQFDVASLLGHHQQRAKDPAVVAAAAAITSALTNRFSEANEEKNIDSDSLYLDRIKYGKNVHPEGMDDEEDDDGNHSDNSMDDNCSFPNLQHFQEYKAGVAAPGIGHKSFFTPIRDASNAPSSDMRIHTANELNERETAKRIAENLDIETTSEPEHTKPENEIRKLEDDSNQNKHQIGTEIDTKVPSRDEEPSTVTKCVADDPNMSKDLGALRSSLSFMQAASAQQSLNNNLFQESHSNLTNSTVSPHEYLARYYQIMQQHQQHAAAAAMNGSTVLSTRHNN